MEKFRCKKIKPFLLSLQEKNKKINEKKVFIFEFVCLCSVD